MNKTDWEVLWLMLKDWMGETFGRRPHFVLAPGYQEGWIK